MLQQTFRKQGRNKKGNGGSARKRQLKKKQQQMLRENLKGNDKLDNQPQNNPRHNNAKTRQGKEKFIFPLFFYFNNCCVSILIF
ncbi:hypothetical protein RintRC_6311 [Richelia intracellularis]|nr:hypothetical protein RintRC_6311 [Richelia intracellularis]